MMNKNKSKQKKSKVKEAHQVEIIILFENA